MLIALQGVPPVGIKLTSCVDAATSLALDAYDLSELRIFIGHPPPTHLLTAKRLIWLQQSYWDPLECSCSRTPATLRPGCGDLSKLVFIHAQSAPFINPSRRSLAGTTSLLLQVCPSRLINLLSPGSFPAFYCIDPNFAELLQAEDSFNVPL